MDKRRHPRLHLEVPIRFIVAQPEIRECQDGKGMLKDISQGGILFQAEPPLPVEPGQIRDFSFFLMPENVKQYDPAHLHAQGLVLRIEPPEPNSKAYGVAVQFLSALTKEDVPIRMTLYRLRRGSA
jgi:hypothetical protein